MRGKPVIRRVVASRDIERAADYYHREAGKRVELSFLEEMENAFLHLGVHAASGSLRYAQGAGLRDLRFWPLRRHPYLIFYFDRSDHIDVWRVLHANRDVPAWLHEGERDDEPE